MKRVLFSICMLVFLFASIVFAADDKGCSEAVKKACAIAKSKKGCAEIKADKASVQNLEKSDEIAKEDHVCPDVSARAAFREFHESMHPMHVALSENNFDAIREGLPNLIKASKTVDKYKCEGHDKCSKDCRKTFDNRKDDLMDAVKSLKKACKGKNDEKVTASFDKMHEAFTTLASTCAH